MQGRENVYTCQTCGGHTTTIDLDEGVTPFMIGCRAKKGCHGDAYSAFYPKGPRPAHIPAPSHEWYKPVGEELASMSEAMQEHVAKGGLNLRKIGETKGVDW